MGTWEEFKSIEDEAEDEIGTERKFDDAEKRGKT